MDRDAGGLSGEGPDAMLGHTPGVLRFSLLRMLMMTALLGAWLGGLRALTLPWSLWLTTTIFYLAVMLLFVPRARPR